MQSFRRYLPHFLFPAAAVVTALTMKGGSLSDDQITYWVRAEIITDFFHRGQICWDFFSTFSLLLALAHRWLATPVSCLIAIYLPVAILYFYSMKWSLDYFIKDTLTSVLVSLVSITPLYTLGMTYWGFAGFEFITGRILIMPLAPAIIRLFCEWMEDKRIWIPFLLCGLGMMLSVEIMYLLLALALAFLVLSMRPATLRSQRYRAVGTAILSIGIVGFVYWLQIFLTTHNPTPFASFDAVPYSKLIEVYGGFVDHLRNDEYVDLLWRASYAAFWWTMFPIRWTDLSFALFNALFLLPCAALGLALLKNRNKRLFWDLFGLVACLCAVAFGYQILRFIGWKVLGWPPHVLEEYRAIKYAYFPLYVGAGFILQSLWARQKRIYVFGLGVLLVVSPLTLVRSLPQVAKRRIVEIAATTFEVNGLRLQYLQKALRLSDPEEKRDVENIINSLRARPSDSPEFVLSDIHSLTLSGKLVMLSYQSKRGGGPPGANDARKSYLPYWYLAYSEISSALHSKNADQLPEIARKYGCRYIVTERIISDPVWSRLYEGQKYNLYYELQPR